MLHKTWKIILAYLIAYFDYYFQVIIFKKSASNLFFQYLYSIASPNQWRPWFFFLTSSTPSRFCVCTAGSMLKPWMKTKKKRNFCPSLQINCSLSLQIAFVLLVFFCRFQWISEACEAGKVLDSHGSEVTDEDRNDCGRLDNFCPLVFDYTFFEFLKPVYVNNTYELFSVGLTSTKYSIILNSFESSNPFEFQNSQLPVYQDLWYEIGVNHRIKYVKGIRNGGCFLFASLAIPQISNFFL